MLLRTLFLRCSHTGHMYAGNISDWPTFMVPPLPSVSSHVLRWHKSKLPSENTCSSVRELGESIVSSQFFCVWCLSVCVYVEGDKVMYALARNLRAIIGLCLYLCTSGLLYEAFYLTGWRSLCACIELRCVMLSTDKGVAVIWNFFTIVMSSDNLLCSSWLSGVRCKTYEAQVHLTTHEMLHIRAP